MTELKRIQIERLEHELPLLKELNRRKTRTHLSEEEEARWLQLYLGILSLFGSRHAGLLEQRNSMRVPCRFRVDLKVDQERFYAMSYDMSLQGLAIEFSDHIHEDAKLSMTIHLSRRRLLGLLPGVTIETHGTVRWKSREANRVGISFDGLSPLDQQRIEDTIFKRIQSQVAEALTRAKADEARDFLMDDG